MLQKHSNVRKISPNTGLPMIPMSSEEIENGWYELRLGDFTDFSRSTFMCHLEKTGDYVENGVNNSYIMTQPLPGSVCGDAFQYVWRRKFNNPYTMSYIRPLLPFEIIKLKFQMHGWCKMSSDNIFNHKYLSGKSQFIRK